MSLSYNLNQLAEHIGARLQGDGRCVITHVGPLHPGKAGTLTFCRPGKFSDKLRETQASAVIVAADDAEICPVPALIVENPETAFAKIATLFDQAAQTKPGIHPTALIGENCQIPASCYIGPYVVIEEGVTLGEGCRIHAHSVIAHHCQIGDHCTLGPRVTLYPLVSMGHHSIIHSGSVIGSDGFGYTPTASGWKKTPQIGTVEIGSHVEIGANTTIDRGALESTQVGDGVKLDNLIQLAHNTKIGQNTVIAACTGIAGSTVIGKNCIIAGGVGFAGHLQITDGVTITGMAMVTKSITEPGVYSSGTGLLPSQEWRKNAVRFRHLNELAAKVKELETQLKHLLAEDSHD